MAEPRQAVGPAGLRVRRAVADLLAEAGRAGLLERGVVGVALSGGADSLALTDAAVHAAAKVELDVHAIVVDHGLQEGSAAVAKEAAEVARQLGVQRAQVVAVTVDTAATGGGLEAVARRARYAALREALPGAMVLLGHTRDDQAETVLLGLGRGSGPRSISGMRPLDPPWGRPLLDIPREITARACAELGLTPWQDPHNTDHRFTRVRLRAEVLPLLEEALQGGVADALARTAAQLREDGEALDAIADDLLSAARSGKDLEVGALVVAHPAVRRRAIRTWLLGAGAFDLTDRHLRAVDDLVGRWRGQGAVWLPGDLVAGRSHGKLHVSRAEPSVARTRPQPAQEG